MKEQREQVFIQYKKWLYYLGNPRPILLCLCVGCVILSIRSYHLSPRPSFHRIPLPRSVITSEVEERSSMVREVLNEPPVEVGKAKKRLYFLLAAWDRPFGDSGHFNRVHADRVVGYNDSKILHLCPLKLTLLRLKE